MAQVSAWRIACIPGSHLGPRGSGSGRAALAAGAPDASPAAAAVAGAAAGASTGSTGGECLGRWDMIQYWYNDYRGWLIIVSSSPPARWGLLDFIRTPLPTLLPLPPPRQSSSQSFSPSPSVSPILFAELLANPLRQLRIGDQRWTSTARVRAQWAPLDLNRQGPSGVSTAGPQPRTSELREHRWTSTARSKDRYKAT